jgi:hypothetical protein
LETKKLETEKKKFPLKSTKGQFDLFQGNVYFDQSLQKNELDAIWPFL